MAKSSFGKRFGGDAPAGPSAPPGKGGKRPPPFARGKRKRAPVQKSLARRGRY